MSLSKYEFKITYKNERDVTASYIYVDIEAEYPAQAERKVLEKFYRAIGNVNVTSVERTYRYGNKLKDFKKRMMSIFQRSHKLSNKKNVNQKVETTPVPLKRLKVNDKVVYDNKIYTVKSIEKDSSKKLKWRYGRQSGCSQSHFFITLDYLGNTISGFKNYSESGEKKFAKLVI